MIKTLVPIKTYDRKKLVWYENNHHKPIFSTFKFCSIFSLLLCRSWNATSFSSFDLENAMLCMFCYWCVLTSAFLVNMELEGVMWRLNLSKMHLFANLSLAFAAPERRLWRSMFSQPWTFWCIAVGSSDSW